jgi:phage shock protein C
MYAQGSPAPPPPPLPSYPYGPRRLRRSLHDRRLGGVIGGLAEYLSVDSTALRIGYVFLSIAPLAGIGGVVLYVLAWIVMPEGYDLAGPAPAPTGSRFTAPPPNSQGQWGRPWHDWDRVARSWAIVLGALALSLLWTFGLGNGFHWPAWILWVGLWIVLGRTRLRSRMRRAWRGPYGPGGRPPYGPGPGAPATPATPGSGTGTYYGWSTWGTAPRPGEAAPQHTPSSAEGHRVDGDPAETDDRVKAEREAAAWADAQLAAAGVPKNVPDLGAPNRRQRHVGAFVAVGVSALFLMVVCAGLGISVVSGASFRGGVGHTVESPTSLAEVQNYYRWSVGDLQVDLSAVDFRGAHTKTVHFSVGAGNLLITVPEATAVEVNAGAGVGHINVFGQTGTGLQVSQGVSPRQKPQLVIDAHVGVGNISVQQARSQFPRAAPGVPLPPPVP